MTEMKTSDEYQECIKCERVKLSTDFHKDHRRQNGRRDECKQCRNLHRRIIHKAQGSREQILEAQDNACGICGVSNEDTETKFVMDHNHNTHLIRGILCSNCNVGLGYFKDQPARLALAIDYLKRTDGIT